MADFVTLTTGCQQHGHSEFRLVYNDDLVTEKDLQYLVEKLERSVAEGDRYPHGAPLQIGWVVARVREGDDGTITIQEPDMTHTPVWWIDSVNHSLLHRRLQRGVCASLVGTERALFPSSQEAALVCECFGESDGVLMRREPPSEGFSGWVFGCDSSDHDHSDAGRCSTLSLYEVAVGYDPRVIPYLALPQGVAVRLHARGPLVTMEGRPLAIRAGSLLDRNFPTTAD